MAGGRYLEDTTEGTLEKLFGTFVDQGVAGEAFVEEFEQDPIGPTTHDMRAGGGGARSLIVCCSLEFDEPAVHPLTQLMPEVLVLRRADASDPALPTLLSLMAAEVASRRVGAATVMARLADAVVTCMVRNWAETHAGNLKGWLAGARRADRPGAGGDPSPAGPSLVGRGAGGDRGLVAFSSLRRRRRSCLKVGSGSGSVRRVIEQALRGQTESIVNGVALQS